MKYLVIIVKGKNYGAYSPDVPGCVATDKNREKVEQKNAKCIASSYRVDDRGWRSPARTPYIPR